MEMKQRIRPEENTPNPQKNNVYVDLKSLPSFSDLNKQVQSVVRSSSSFERYGYDWIGIIGALVCVPAGLYLLSLPNILCIALGLFLLGCYHNCIAQKAGHLSSHGAYTPWESFNKIMFKVCVEFVGSFPAYLGYDIHIKYHHPHTNIIGLGDSSSWKAPYLSCIPYMFFAPLLLPVITPFFGIAKLIEAKQWKQLVQFMFIMPCGLAFHTYLIMNFCGYTFTKAIILLFVYRSALSIPYIHINIFQHIGLPMYSKENRPARIYQMSTGSLNLSRNFLLDLTFGHSLVNCHVEHHLFPRLSDNMCLKIKPLVYKYLTDNGLPYNEKSYWDRFQLFMKNYDTLMVKAPPVTHFIGIQ